MLASHSHPQQPSCQDACLAVNRAHKGAAEREFEMQLRMSSQSLRPRNSIFA